MDVSTPAFSAGGTSESDLPPPRARQEQQSYVCPSSNQNFLRPLTRLSLLDPSTDGDDCLAANPTQRRCCNHINSLYATCFGFIDPDTLDEKLPHKASGCHFPASCLPIVSKTSPNPLLNLLHGQYQRNGRIRLYSSQENRLYAIFHFCTNAA